MPNLAPAKYDFTLVRGDTFSEVWTFKDSAGVVIDLSAATLLFQIKSTDLATTHVTHNPAGGASGTITFNITAATTAALSWTGKVPWDLQVTYSDNTVETIIKGLVELYLDIAIP